MKTGNLSEICDSVITINVPLFKKLRDIIFFWWDNHFMSHFEGHFEGAKHRVDRVLSVSPVVGIGTPSPLQPQASVPPHPLVWGGGLKGWGSPNSNEGTYTVVLYIYKYFVGPRLF